MKDPFQSSWSNYPAASEGLDSMIFDHVHTHTQAHVDSCIDACCIQIKQLRLFNSKRECLLWRRDMKIATSARPTRAT